jgi:hypothetical protein
MVKKQVIVVYSGLSLGWLLLMAAIFSFIFSGCHRGDDISGSGRITTEERQIGHFSEVEIMGPFEIHLKQGPDGPVVIKAEDNVIPLIDTYVRGEVLRIDVDDDVSFHRVKPIHIYLQSSTYRYVGLYGSGSVENEDTLRVPQFRYTLDGSGDARLTLAADKLETEVHGAGSILYKGSAASYKCRLDGSGDIDALDLKTKNSDIEIFGAGDHTINVSQTLDVAIYGSGDVRYKGDPHVESKIYGSGKVSRL